MISVCMATYNGAKYIKEQVDSILQRLDDNDRLVISDDCSSDNTVDILKSYADPRIKIFHHTPDKKDHKYSKGHYLSTKNFENALINAKGDYIFLSDQDDIWENDKVRVSMEDLSKHDLIVSNHSIIDKDGNMKEDSHFTDSPLQESILQNLKHPYFQGDVWLLIGNVSI